MPILLYDIHQCTRFCSPTSQALSLPSTFSMVIGEGFLWSLNSLLTRLA